MKKAENSSMSEAEAWNRYMMSAIDAARAHIDYEILRRLHGSVQSLPKEYLELKLVLTRVMYLFILGNIVNPNANSSSKTWLEDDYFTYSQIVDIRDLVDELLGELYQDAVGLTDAWDFTDGSLASAIGCYDGNAYERMMWWVKQVPMNVLARENAGVYNNSWDEVIAPFVKKDVPKL
jgi:acyl-CoA oxidase